LIRYISNDHSFSSFLSLGLIFYVSLLAMLVGFGFTLLILPAEGDLPGGAEQVESGAYTPHSERASLGDF
jgi:hypothetical protein